MIQTTIDSVPWVCERENLQIIINVPTSWGVNEDGSMDNADCYGEGGADELANFDSYYCTGCGTYFTMDKNRSDAWRDALDHLTAKVEV